MPPPVFETRLTEPMASPVLVSIPHAGTYVPSPVSESFASDRIRGLPMTDWHLDSLYDFLPGLGVDTVYATHSRFVVDLNRPPEPRALYPGRFETGLVALTTFDGEDIYSAPPSDEEIGRRRGRYHEPYHEQIQALLDAKIEQFGAAVLVDAHSVASAPSLVHGALKDDVYLGDRDGTSCGEWLTGLLETSFASEGLSVVRNAPYKGGYITDHYGARADVQAIQIEMCQRLYMDEDDAHGALEHENFAGMRVLLERVVRRVAEASLEFMSDYTNRNFK